MQIADLGLAHFVLIAAAAFVTQVIGGLAGYGTGLLMPLVLVPLIGAEPVVPIIALSAVLTNLTRAFVFRQHLDWRRAAIMAAAALPTTALSAYLYTLLSSRGAQILIATTLILLVPLRRFLTSRHWRLGEGGTIAASVVYGLMNGGAVGTGVFMLAILLAGGLSGPQVIATDSAVTILLCIVRSGIFFAAGDLPPATWAIALLIGAMATPGTLVAKRIAHRFSAKLHDGMIEGAIMLGGALMLWRALTGPAG